MAAEQLAARSGADHFPPRADRPTRRGDRRAEQITVRSYGPLGLAARQGSRRLPWTVRVLPPFTSRKHLPSRLARVRELDGRTSVLTRGEGTEFDSLRAYVPGDDVRPAVVGALTPLEPELVETDARGLVAAAIAQAPRRSLAVLLTSLDSAPVEEGLLPVLPQLTQRHTVVVAAVSDPHVACMAGARGTVDAIYEAAAGVEVKAQRGRTADRLRSHGVVVVDATPDDLAPALADAYLALKAAGRL